MTTSVGRIETTLAAPEEKHGAEAVWRAADRHLGNDANDLTTDPPKPRFQHGVATASAAIRIQIFATPWPGST